MSKKHTERGFDRVVNFSDAVVAIAITLLVLPLIDLLNDESKNMDFFQFLQEHMDSILAFAIAFLALAGYWRLHHQLFELLDGYNGVLIRLNTLWLMVVVLLPFLSASLPLTGTGATLFVFLLAIAVLSILLGAMSAYARSRPGLLAPHAERSDFNTRRFWWFAIFEICIALFALWWANLGNDGDKVALALLLLLPLGWLSEWSHRRAVARSADPAPTRATD